MAKNFSISIASIFFNTLCRKTSNSFSWHTSLPQIFQTVLFSFLISRRKRRRKVKKKIKNFWWWLFLCGSNSSKKSQDRNKVENKVKINCFYTLIYQTTKNWNFWNALLKGFRWIKLWWNDFFNSLVLLLKTIILGLRKTLIFLSK